MHSCHTKSPRLSGSHAKHSTLFLFGDRKYVVNDASSTIEKDPYSREGQCVLNLDERVPTRRLSLCILQDIPTMYAVDPQLLTNGEGFECCGRHPDRMVILTLQNYWPAFNDRVGFEIFL